MDRAPGKLHHEVRAPGEGRDGKTAPEGFGEDGKIRRHFKVGLGTAGVNAEAGDHFAGVEAQVGRIDEEL